MISTIFMKFRGFIAGPTSNPNNMTLSAFPEKKNPWKFKNIFIFCPSLNIASKPRLRKSRYWGEMLLSPIHCCDVTKPPYLLSGELCTSPLHSNRLFVYTVCCRRRGQCFSVLRTRHTDVVGDSSGRSYDMEQWHNVPLLRIRDLNQLTNLLTLRVNQLVNLLT